MSVYSAKPSLECAERLLSVAFTDLMGSPVTQAKSVSGIFTSVCDASNLATAQAGGHRDAKELQETMAAASVLVLMITRSDNPAHTEACLKAILAASPAALKVPLLLLTTAADLHQGVQQWVNTLPGKVFWLHCLLPKMTVSPVCSLL